ncbi:MAG: hypothetical protein LBP63_05845 [Prevotellaceae bacterium]|jgi:hypothetical protein|nr:hypothetical protein [Prevotellaceae bacterium]
MKKKIIILTLFLFTVYIVAAQEKEPVWDYPVKPGSEEWAAFKSTEDMYKAVSIPEDVIKKMDTESLVQICLNYPALPTVFLFNSPQDGFDNFYIHFNGIQELMVRKDAGEFLLKKYSALSLQDFNILWTLEKQGEFVHKYYYIELILAQPKILQSLKSDYRKLLLKEAIKKFEEKQSRNDLFGYNALAVNAWILARTLADENKLSSKFSNETELKLSLQSGQLVDYDLSFIYEQAKSYNYE